MSGAVAGRPALLHAAWDVLRAEQRNLMFVARTLLAAAIALFVAFSLQLQAPLSAVTTVLIVAAPTNGAILSKSFWRLVGTLIGAAAAVVLMAVFAQSPLLYTLVLSCCIAAACFVSTLLRFFKAYSAVLAGYTIIIVSAGAFNAPDSIFIGALSRVSAVCTGLGSAALVFLVTVLPRSSALADGIALILRDLAALFVRVRYDDGDAASDRRARAALLARIGALDEAIEYGAAESYALRRRRHALRLAASRLLGLLAAVEPIHGDASGAEEAVAARAIAHRCMARVADRSADLASLSEDMAEAERALLSLSDRARTAEALLVSMHERRLVSDLRRTVSALDAAGDGQSGKEVSSRRVRLRPLPEWHAAGRNAVRGFLVTFIAGLFWYVSQWPSGPSLLAYLIPAACLLSTNPSASRASVQFAIGTFAAVPMALFCQSILLPQIDGFPLLVCSLSLCLAPAIWLQTQARTRLAATGYAIFFCAMINVHNPIGFDDIALLNGLFSFLVGPVLLVLVFRVLLPADISGDARRFGASLTRAVERFARRGLSVRLFGPGTPAARFEIWQDLQMQKVLRLELRATQLPEGAGPRTTRAAYLVLALGRTVAALRVLRRRPDVPPDAREALDRGLAAIARLSRNPFAAAEALSASAAVLALPAVSPEDDARVEVASDPLLAEVGAEAGAEAAPVLEDAPNRIRREARGLLDEAALLIRHAHGLLRRGCPVMLPDRQYESFGGAGAAPC